MIRGRKISLGAVAAIAMATALAGAASARADAVFMTGGTTYTADFSLTSLTDLHLVLTDTGSGQDQGSTISGLTFTSSGFTLGGLTSATGNTVDFNAADPYSTGAGGGYVNGADLLLADGGHWSEVSTGDLTTLTGGKPHELIIGPNGSPNGVGGLSFSPYVDQTGTFDFSISGLTLQNEADATIGPVTFLFGTGPDSSTTTGTPTPPITGGGVPEPASLGMLGLGAMGLMLRRRNRAKQ